MGTRPSPYVQAFVQFRADQASSCAYKLRNPGPRGHHQTGAPDPAGRAERQYAARPGLRHEGIWAGFAVFPGGASTGWHHHGDYATYAYITRGGLTVEFGPGGTELVEVGEGDFIYIPAHLIHRESVAAQGGAGVLVRVGGVGTTVFNVEEPDPAT